MGRMGLRAPVGRRSKSLMAFAALAGLMAVGCATSGPTAEMAPDRAAAPEMAKQGAVLEVKGADALSERMREADAVSRAAHEKLKLEGSMHSHGGPWERADGVDGPQNVSATNEERRD